MQQPASPIDSTSDDRLWVLLGYIFTPIIPIVILLMADKKDRPFIKAHNMQALLLGIVEWVINAIVGVLSLGLLACIPVIVFLVYNIWLAVRANRGEMFDVPVISNFVRQQGW